MVVCEIHNQRVIIFSSLDVIETSLIWIEDLKAELRLPGGWLLTDVSQFTPDCFGGVYGRIHSPLSRDTNQSILRPNIKNAAIWAFIEQNKILDLIEETN